MIGKNIQILRKQKNLTQEALAEEVGVARQTVAKWEAEESAPDLECAGRLAAVLDVTLDDLVSAPTEELDESTGLNRRADTPGRRRSGKKDRLSSRYAPGAFSGFIRETS